VPPDPIVITLDVAEDFRTSLFYRFKNAAFDQFHLKSGKETLGLGVIVIITLARSLIAENREYKAVGGIRLMRIASGDQFE
jgi:hypothetical protein